MTPMDSPTSTENPQASEILATAPLTPMCCGTSQAAKLLHLSVGTVQSLVERKQLRAWKTQGGHRRIDMQSILNYQTQNQMLPALTRLRGMRLKVLVGDDDPVTRHWVHDTCTRNDLGMHCTALASGLEALMEMHQIQPDVLIVDLHMPGVDGCEWVKTVRQNLMFQQLPMLVISALSQKQIQAQAFLPKDCQFMRKPLDVQWLQGYLAGLMKSQSWLAL